MMTWQESILEFKAYLIFEKRLSVNSVEAYLHDVDEFSAFCLREGQISLDDVSRSTIEYFLADTFDKGKERSTQSRIISGLRSFFGFLVLSGKLTQSPIDLISSPKSVRKLPDVLSLEEVDSLIESVDLSNPYGHRNKAILETLYSCGLRVSELTNIKIGDLFFDDGYLRVVGKGNKQRLVPISDEMKWQVDQYLVLRHNSPIAKGEGDYLFLNRRGHHLTRVMIYLIIKEQAEVAGIHKNITPHTLRHSFATHLVKGGADIRMVQDMLGHDSITTTEIYTHLDIKHKSETLRRFHPMSKK
ncbi:MAG: site-specific tyrosine recombinase [Rikenellaceae bacterium]